MAVIPSPALAALAAVRAWSSVTGAAGVGAAWALAEPTVANVRTETIEMLRRSDARVRRRGVLLRIGRVWVTAPRVTRQNWQLRVATTQESDSHWQLRTASPTTISDVGFAVSENPVPPPPA